MPLRCAGMIRKQQQQTNKRGNYAVSISEVRSAADAARERVSGYSEEKLETLSAHAKGAIAGARPKVCCS